MTAEIRLDGHALDRARSDVLAAVDQLRHERAGLGAAAHELFTAGWRGRAAGECGHAFAEWDDGAALVVGSLVELASGLQGAGAELAAGDASSGRDLSRLLARLDGPGSAP